MQQCSAPSRGYWSMRTTPSCTTRSTQAPEPTQRRTACASIAEDLRHSVSICSESNERRKRMTPFRVRCSSAAAVFTPSKVKRLRAARAARAARAWRFLWHRCCCSRKWRSENDGSTWGNYVSAMFTYVWNLELALCDAMADTMADTMTDTMTGRDLIIGALNWTLITVAFCHLVIMSFRHFVILDMMLPSCTKTLLALKFNRTDTSHKCTISTDVARSDRRRPTQAIDASKCDRGYLIGREWALVRGRARDKYLINIQ